MRWALLFLVMLAVMAVAAFWLLESDTVGPAAVVAAPETVVGSQSDVSPAAPAARGTDLRSSRPAAEPLPVVAAEPTASRDTTGEPTRTVSGVLLRAADRSRLSQCKITVFQRQTRSDAGANGVASELLMFFGSDREWYRDWIASEVSSRQPTSDSSDDQGRFSVSGVPLRDADLLISVPTGAPILLQLDDSPGDLTGLQLLVDTGFIVEGYVLDELGTPIEGATLTIGSNPAVSTDAPGGQTFGPAPDPISQLASVWPSATTDAAGAFRLEDLVARRESRTLSLVIQAQGYVVGEREVVTPLSPTTLGPVEIRLKRSGTITGTVTILDPAATDVLSSGDANVAVVYEMTPDSGRSPGLRLRTQVSANGRYSIEGVPPGRFILEASVATRRKAGSPMPLPISHQWKADISVTPGDTTQVDWILGTGALISGRVVDTAGRPVPDVALQLKRLIQWDAPEANNFSMTRDGRVSAHTILTPTGYRVYTSWHSGFTRTDALGHYSFEHVASGNQRLTIMAAPAGLLTPDPLEFTAGEGQQLREVSFVMERGVVLRGQVRDQFGQPLPDARVQVSAAQKPSWDHSGDMDCDADGRFEIGGLREDESLTLWVSHGGFADHFQELTPTEQLIAVTLRPSVILTVVVLVAETGLPQVPYAVTITQDTVTRSREVSDPAGRFALELDDDIPVTITVSAPGRRTTTLPGIRPSDSQHAALEIRLPPGP
ncbi:MAG: protocatechuate 3,4-dioxygenase beta subunit [Pseudohongiellaceae bacterium]|jgi:protocatechuate 3,4-dioxygenase beta subunit